MNGEAPSSATSFAFCFCEWCLNLRENLIDELQLAMSSVLLGRGEALFEGLDWRALGYCCDECIAGEKATHAIIRRRGD